MNILLTILGWFLFGLIVGALARLLIPGRDPMSLTMTAMLGVVGSFVGGGIGWLFTGDPYSPAGWILSIVGAILTLLTYYWMRGGRSRLYPNT